MLCFKIDLHPIRHLRQSLVWNVTLIQQSVRLIQIIYQVNYIFKEATGTRPAIHLYLNLVLPKNEIIAIPRFLPITSAFYVLKCCCVSRELYMYCDQDSVPIRRDVKPLLCWIVQFRQKKMKFILLWSIIEILCSIWCEKLYFSKRVHANMRLLRHIIISIVPATSSHESVTLNF